MLQSMPVFFSLKLTTQHRGSSLILLVSIEALTGLQETSNLPIAPKKFNLNALFFIFFYPLKPPFTYLYIHNPILLKYFTNKKLRLAEG